MKKSYKHAVYRGNLLTNVEIDGSSMKADHVEIISLEQSAKLNKVLNALSEDTFDAVSEALDMCVNKGTVPNSARGLVSSIHFKPSYLTFLLGLVGVDYRPMYFKPGKYFTGNLTEFSCYVTDEQLADIQEVDIDYVRNFATLLA